MLLRTSGEAEGTSVELRPVMDGSGSPGSTIPHSEALLSLSEAAVNGTDEELHAARRRVLQELGPAELVDAAGVIGNFEKMVRIADSTGIPLDEFLEEKSADFRADIGINEFAG